MRYRVSTAMDSDALQADVMRFMAIIAFCLIAVLALVRQIEPATTDLEPATTASLEQPAAAYSPPVMPLDRSEPALVEQQMVPTPVTQNEVESRALLANPPAREAPAVAAPAPEAPAQEQAAAVAVMDREVPAVEAPAAEVQEPEEFDTPVAAPGVAAVEVPQTVVAPEPTTPEAPGDEGLILRFVTDQDFLRLVARGDIRVFLFGAEAAYRLRPDYRFASATTPRELFEVMPETVPALIRDRAADVPGISALRYGLQFPDRIERQLDAYLARVESGALLIDRYGHVSHVPAED